MKNPFVSPRWDAKRRAWITAINRAGIVAIVLLTVASLMGAATQINLPTQVRGILAIVNGGTGTSSTLTGLVRGSASAMTAAELSGDCTTSGSNVITCQKDNGTTVPTNAAADTVLLTTASATGSWAAVPNCTGALSYNTSTHAFGCNTVLSGTFADDETPTGLVNGANTTYTLAHTPSPALSLSLYKNGQKLEPAGADFTLATATITMATAPATGDIITAHYRW